MALHTATRDQELIRGYGAATSSREPLRDAEFDVICTKPCEGCGETLSTEGERATHELQHVQDGTMIASMMLGHPYVNVRLKAEHEEDMEMCKLFGHREPVVLVWEQISGDTNLIRALCAECGNSCYARGYDGSLIHLDSEMNLDHEAVL